MKTLTTKICGFSGKITTSSLPAFFFRTNSYGNPYEFYFDGIRTNFEKLTEMCLFLTRKIVKKFVWIFQRKNICKFLFFSLGKPYGKFARILQRKHGQVCLLFTGKTVRKIRTDFKEKNVQLSLLFTRKTVQKLRTDFFEGKTYK